MLRKPEKVVNFINAKAFYVALLLIVILCDTSFGQSITWQRTYDGPLHEDDIGYDICEADGDNFYIVGYANNSPNVIFTIKIDKFGETIWTRTLSHPNGLSIRAFAVVSSGDGGCVLTGSWDSSFTIKYDMSGNLVWLKFYGGNNIDCYDILRTADGGYLSCGRVHLNGYILKIDSSGNFLWDRTLTSMGVRAYLSTVNSIDQGMILAGAFSVTPNVPGDALFTKLDSSGNILNENKFKMFSSSTSITSICNTERYYFAAGNFFSGQDSRVFISKLGLNGEIIDTISFYSMRNEYEPRLVSINSNRIVYTSIKDTTYPIPSFVLIRILDSSFNVIDQKSFRWTEDLTIKSILPVNNGDILFAGWSKDPAPIRANVYALRTDSMLNAMQPIGILSQNNNVPNQFMLESFPNPFNPNTKIRYYLPEKANITVKVFDINGKEITTLVNGDFRQGNHVIDWQPENCSSGIYFITLYANNELQNYIKIIYLK